MSKKSYTKEVNRKHTNKFTIKAVLMEHYDKDFTSVQEVSVQLHSALSKVLEDFEQKGLIKGSQIKNHRTDTVYTSKSIADI